MKRKMFGLDELTRMAGYTATEIANARTNLRAADDERQDELIDALRSLQSQAASIARNIEALKTKAPKAPRTKAPARTGTRPRRATAGRPMKCKIRPCLNDPPSTPEERKAKLCGPHLAAVTALPETAQ